MEDKGVLKSRLTLSEISADSLCAMYFGVSCALFALKNASEQGLGDRTCSETWEKMLQGSANLLGLLVWRVQKCELRHKLDSAEREIGELKWMRHEDAKANEKVASMYAAQEHGWFIERRKLRQQVGTLVNDLRILDRRKTEAISELNGKLEEMTASVKSKDKILEEVEKRRNELEEKVKSVEDALEGLREATKREAEDHSSELLKHKTAFIELVSNQRQLEAELSRALRQGDIAKEQLDYVFEEKEEAVLMVQELSVELERTRKESERKDKVLSAMMRKSKLDSAEIQTFVKEAKLSKSRRNKDDSETDKWRAVPGSRIGRRTLRNILSRQNSSRLDVFPDGRGDNSVCSRVFDVNKIELEPNDDTLDDLGAEVRKQLGDYFLHYNNCFPDKCCNHDEATQFDDWVHIEAERYHNAFEKRHQLELDSITDQMHLKEDKLEACRWRLLSAEVEKKRLQSKIEGLNNELSQLRHDNFKIETLLLDREVELKTLKDQIALQLNYLNAEKTKLHSSKCEPRLADDTVWSKMKLIKKKPAEKEKTKRNLAETEARKEEEFQSVSGDSSSTFLSPAESVVEKETLLQLPQSGIELSSLKGLETGKEEAAAKLCSNKRNGSTWKVDLHALGVSYKIKRLNQQLLMLDRLTGKQESSEVQESEEQEKSRMMGFSRLLSLLNKQVSRYQSLQEKADNLSKRMGEKELNLKQRVPISKRTKEETRKLEKFLEETFQLQRFIVATGQKLIEIQSKITSGFDGIVNEFEGSASFDMKRFAETIQTLVKDVQRGLKVRISRIIGDLGGTLACDEIHFRM